MSKISLIYSLVSFFVSVTAQMPERTPENIEKYKEICREYIHKEMKGMYREPGGLFHSRSWLPAVTSISTCSGTGIHGSAMLH